MMKPLVLMTLCSLLLIAPSYGQAPETDLVAKKEVSKLGFIVGDWQGEGWRMGPDGNKYTFTQTEKIQFKLDSTAILIEGLGKSDGRIIHNALAIVTYNSAEDNYDFDSYLATGRRGNFKAELNDDKFYWYPRENMRYIISVNDQGQWYETGEMNRGGSWFQFFEMTLDKK